MGGGGGGLVCRAEQGASQSHPPLDNSNDSQKVQGIATGKLALRATDLGMEQEAWPWGWELRSLSL